MSKDSGRGMGRHHIPQASGLQYIENDVEQRVARTVDLRPLYALVTNPCSFPHGR